MLKVAVLYPRGSSRSFPLSGSVCIHRGVAEMVLNGRRAVGSSDSGAEGVQSLVGLPPLMGLSAGVPEVAVALIDGPVALDHPQLAAENVRKLPGPTGASCTEPDSVACTHGTYVAGVLHAKRDSSTIGICPGCILLVRPIFPEGVAVPETDGLPNATVDELSAALNDVIDAGARIVNLSVGLAQAWSRAGRLLEDALEKAARRGVIVVAAGGNQ